MSEYIEDCPFCNHDAELEYEEQEIPSKNKWVRVVCTDCGASSGWYLSKEQAIAAWNKRYGN